MTSFWGAFIGAAAGTLILVGVVILIVYLFDKAKHRINEKERTFFLEHELEEYLVANFARLFPGWTIYDDLEARSDSLQEGRTLLGREYKIGGGRIDILAVDDHGSFVVIELKRGRASRQVIVQMKTYMASIRQRLAKGKDVKGLIIVNSIDKAIVDLF